MDCAALNRIKDQKLEMGGTAYLFGSEGQGSSQRGGGRTARGGVREQHLSKGRKEEVSHPRDGCNSAPSPGDGGKTPVPGTGGAVLLPETEGDRYGARLM